MPYSIHAVEKNFSRKLVAILGTFFLVQYILAGFLLYQITLKETSGQITTIAERVKEDLSYKNGKWDTNRYNADPDLPGTYPLYVFATDGYVIDRWKPLHGFLDT